MNFRHLAETLRPLADAVVQYFDAERGIRHFVEEESIHVDVARPSLHAAANDSHYWCIEFSESTPFPPALDRFVLDCVRRGLPVKLFVVLPGGSTSPDYHRDLNRAREYGVGIIEVTDGNVRVINEPVSLSLAGVRRIDKGKFPSKYRLPLTEAESTFRQGNPAKGCSEVYDQIEALTRRVAQKTKDRGMWNAARTGKPIPKHNLKKVAWAKLVKLLMAQLDPGQPPKIDEALLGRILGITQHRNESGHKPESRQALIRRDEQLRTRFETATDLPLDLVSATKALRV